MEQLGILKVTKMPKEDASMSRLWIAQYHTEVEKIIQYGGSRKETSIRVAFQNLLNEYCKTRDFLLIPELDYRTKAGKVVYPDGTVKDALRLEWGYWESKDQYDNLDEEIDKKLQKGYPDDNIIFEDSQTAVLIQGGEEKLRVSMGDAEKLDTLLNAFINYVRPEVKDFQEAISSFQEDLPTILAALRNLLEQQTATNQKFQQARDNFLEICRQSINPEITLLEVREMIIQHILTEDIFINIFNESQFHRENNIARELQGVIETFFTGSTKKNILSTIERYYAVIRRTAASIYNHHEKQKFLKAVYENFYKAYNPKAADRLGIVYTPNEIVKFMIESVDYLVHKHFGKLLADPGVEILDPATGTGTFITELIEYLPKNKLKYKYQKEIHCNEVAILPYYIANLNIEFTYKQKMGEYEEFNHICFVDTLDHTVQFHGRQYDLFAMTVENTARIQEQNDRSISVIIGNPPYNAKQENFNQNNANRKYTEIDKRIKETYIKEGTAQNQIVVYDMYTRFIRWASDRLDKNGVIAFVTNSSFVDALAYDGFRKVLADEFSDVYIIDLGGNVRVNPKLSGTKNNVFGIQTGVAITFIVKKEHKDLPCKIFYLRRPEFDKAGEKLRFLGHNKLNQLSFEHIIPDKNNNWLNQSDNDFDELLPLVDKEVKSGKSQEAVFKLFSSGLKTQRDEWMYDRCRDNLESKVKFFVEIYKFNLQNPKHENKYQIKWDEDLISYLNRKINKDFEQNSINKSLYRPYTRQYLYFDKHFNGRTYQWFNIFQKLDINYYICLSGIGSSKSFQCLASNQITCLDCLEKTQCLPLHRYDENGNRIDNITDWGLKQFQEYYQPSPPLPPSPTGEGGERQERQGKQGEVSKSKVNEVAENQRIEGNAGESQQKKTTTLLPSPVGEGLGERANPSLSVGQQKKTTTLLPSPAGEGQGERANPDLSTLVGARRKIPKKLLQRAKELRKKQTSAENILWECVRANRLCGAKFRRQHNIGQYIVDFYCHAAKLVIELDGEIHNQQKDQDQNRDEWLKTSGLTILRFKNEAIFSNLEETLTTIISNFPPSLLPSPVGERQGERATRAITKLDIFHYTYAVLHNPQYRKKYELNLKRDFPRLPFYDDFWQWVTWGQQLMELHINFETVQPYPLQRIDIPLDRAPKPKLKADKPNGKIILDEITTLEGVPPLAWEYILGNRSALEWVLDQYKEKTTKDKTIADKFNTYRFIDYKEKVINLLQKVCAVSVKTMKIIGEMESIEHDS